jgi:Hemerythrin HHE cation binding domain
MAQKTTRTRASGAKSSSRTQSRIPKRKTGARRASSNALTMLRDDHTALSKLFDNYDGRKKRLSADQKRQLAEEICLELKIHAQLEEELFYPALREALRSDSDADMLDEAEVEHASAKDLIAQIEGESSEAELYDAKVKVLGEYVKHHVKEEQGDIFKLARKLKLDLKALGEQMAERKQQVQQEMQRAA